ncbi:MAG: rRNA maturation RNase YbeY [Proteobacteria bacterium]|nr:rRNA maturation RNase YbeY [Pseudomonadota bacterium]NBY20160.1 rRNA maturation RNase YbeY [bacterium]
MAARINITVLSPQGFSPRLKTQLKRAALKTLDSIPKRILLKKIKRVSEGNITIAVVSSKKIQNLNFKYRKKNKPTDVLSFSRMETSPDFFPAVKSDLGDVLICWQVAKKQAREDKVTIREELSRLTIHGVLHLFGYDHEISEEEEKKMFRLQDKILKKLG